MAESKKGKRVEFDIPEGLHVPEGVEPGKDFDMVTTFRVKEDGKTMCIVQIGDFKMPGYDGKDEEDTEHKPSYRQYATDMMAQMPGQAGGQPAPAQPTGGY